jgi:hypothetical protein
MAASVNSRNTSVINNSKKGGKKVKAVDRSFSNDVSKHSVSPNVSNCGICNDLIDENDDFLKCNTCNRSMHGVCWDPDATTQIFSYLATVGNSIRLYCPMCTAENKSITLLEERIKKIEDHLNEIVRSLNKPSNLIMDDIVPSTTDKQAITQPPTQHTSASVDIHGEIYEALEREKRKSNLIIYNITPGSDDAQKITALFEQITGNQAPKFICNRIGKTIVGKVRPILVKFNSEHDANNILYNA